ncbi:hypothetical protein [Streptomyces sp. NPDC002611]
MGVGDVLDHAMSWTTRARDHAVSPPTPCPGSRPGRGRTADGRGAVEGLAEGGGADAGRTGLGVVDPPQG